MHNSSSLTDLLSRLLRVIRGRSGAVPSTYFCERLLERTGSSAPEDVGTPLAELISESNHFLCCGSAVNSPPHDHTVPSNEHADLIWSRLRRIEDRLLPLHWSIRGALFAVGRLYCLIKLRRCCPRCLGLVHNDHAHGSNPCPEDGARTSAQC